MIENTVAVTASSVLFLTVATSLLVVVCELVVRRVARARLQRAAWQLAIVSMLLIVTLELSGVGRGLAKIAHGSFDTPPIAAPASIAVVQHSADPSATNAAPARPLSKAGRDTVDSINEMESSTQLPPVGFEDTAYIASDEPSVSGVPSITAYPAIEPSRSSALPSAWISVVATIAVVIWLGGCSLLFVRLTANRIRLCVFRSCPRVRDADVLAMVRRLKHSIGLRQQVRVHESAAIRTPVTFGVWRPTIVLPVGFKQELSPPQQEVVLAHEVAHLAGWDAGWLLVADMAGAILWWNPAVWFARQRLQLASEWVADEACLALPDGPGTLAACLVHIGRRMHSERRWAWHAATGGDGQSALARRVCRLLMKRERTPGALRRGATIGAVLMFVGAMVLVFGVVAWSRPWVEFSNTEESDMSGSIWKRGLLASVLAMSAGDQSDANARDVDRVDPPAGEHLIAYYDGEEERERGDRDRPQREGEADRERDGERRRDGEPARGDRDRERRPDGEGERRDRPNPEQMMRKLHERMKALERQAVELHEARRRLGERDGEKAEVIERRVHEIEREMERTRRGMEEIEHHIRRRREGDRDRPRGGGEAHHRVEHLRQASAHLREAGFEDQARRVAEHAEHLARELRDGRDADEREGRRHVRVERPDSERRERNGAEVNQLREEIHDLRRELQRMRNLIREVLDEEAEEDDEDEDEDDEDEDDEEDEDEDD